MATVGVEGLADSRYKRYDDSGKFIRPLVLPAPFIGDS